MNKQRLQAIIDHVTERATDYIRAATDRLQEEEVDQDKMRDIVDSMMELEDNEFIEARELFIAEFGEEQWDRQMELAVSRQQRRSE